MPVVLHMRQCLKPRHLQPERLPSGSGTDLDAGGSGGIDRGLAHWFFWAVLGFRGKSGFEIECSIYPQGPPKDCAHAEPSIQRSRQSRH